jgi:hypothetical protein
VTKITFVGILFSRRKVLDKQRIVDPPHLRGLVGSTLIWNAKVRKSQITDAVHCVAKKQTGFQTDERYRQISSDGDAQRFA